MDIVDQIKGRDAWLNDGRETYVGVIVCRATRELVRCYDVDTGAISHQPLAFLIVAED